MAPKILSGEKSHTIRARRKRPFRVGDRLYLKTGQRTQYCRSLGETICTQVDHIRIYADSQEVIINGKLLCQDEIEILAKNDGFESVDEFYEYFGPRYNYDFEGQLIWWNPKNISP